jgi:hypothetical protein
VNIFVYLALYLCRQLESFIQVLLNIDFDIFAMNDMYVEQEYQVGIFLENTYSVP